MGVFSALHLPFLGFTYTQGSLLTDMSRVLVHSNGDAAELSISSTTPSSSNVNGVSSNSSSNDSTNDVRRLQDEVNQLTKSRGELLQQLNQIEQQSKELSTVHEPGAQRQRE